MLNGSLLISWACDYPVPFTCITYKALGDWTSPSSLEGKRGPYQSNHGYVHVHVSFFGFFGGFTVSKADVVCPRQRGYPLRSPQISQTPSLVLNAIWFGCYSLGVASTPWLIWYCFQPIIQMSFEYVNWTGFFFGFLIHPGMQLKIR